MDIGLLEDNPAILEYMQIALELNGHRAHLHTEGTSLLETLFPEHELHVPLPYDVVIIDLNLPRGFSGQEVIARIRERIAQRSLPLIIVSGAGPDKVAQVQASFPDIPALRKPFHLHTLLQLIETGKGATSTHIP